MSPSIPEDIGVWASSSSSSSSSSVAPPPPKRQRAGSPYAGALAEAALPAVGRQLSPEEAAAADAATKPIPAEELERLRVRAERPGSWEVRAFLVDLLSQCDEVHTNEDWQTLYNILTKWRTANGP